MFQLIRVDQSDDHLQFLVERSTVHAHSRGKVIALSVSLSKQFEQ